MYQGRRESLVQGGYKETQEQLVPEEVVRLGQRETREIRDCWEIKGPLELTVTKDLRD